MKGSELDGDIINNCDHEIRTVILDRIKIANMYMIMNVETPNAWKINSLTMSTDSIIIDN